MGKTTDEHKKFAKDLLDGKQYAIKEICLDYVSMLGDKIKKGENVTKEINSFIDHMILNR